MAQVSSKVKGSRKTMTPKRTRKKATAKASSKKSARKAKRKKAPKKSIGSCFVLMPFKEPFNTYYNGIIKPGVTAAGLDPLRGDSLFRPSPIMGDIWQMIQDARIIVAEMTGQNANVFYELGLAHAIGKPVVLISETMDDVPFDLQALRVILYDKDNPAWGNKLRTSLTTSLGQTLANPIDSVPPMFRKKVKSQAPAESETSLRMSALERQVASLIDSESIPSPLSNAEALQLRIKKAQSRNEIMHLTLTALKDGVPPPIIKRALESTLSRSDASRIFSAVVLPHSS